MTEFDDATPGADGPADPAGSEVENPEDTRRAESETPPAKPASGRMPARASRGTSGRYGPRDIES